MTNTNDEKEVNEPEKKGFSLFAPLGNANDKKEGEDNKPAFSGSLFGSKPAFSGSLFGNNGTSDNKESKPLFGGQ